MPESGRSHSGHRCSMKTSSSALSKSVARPSTERKSRLHVPLQSFRLGGEASSAGAVSDHCDFRCGRELLHAFGSRRRSFLHHQGHGHPGILARCNGRRDAVAGCRPHRKAPAGIALFRLCQDLFATRRDRPAAGAEGQCPRSTRAGHLVPDAQEEHRPQKGSSRRRNWTGVQRRIRRCVLRRLHAFRRGSKPCRTQRLCRDGAPASTASARRCQGRHHRDDRSAHLHRVQLQEALDARGFAAGRDRQYPQAERNGARGLRRDRRRLRADPSLGCFQRCAGRGRSPGRSQRHHVSPWRYRRRKARLPGPAEFSRTASRQARGWRIGRHGRGRQCARTRRQPRYRSPRSESADPDRHSPRPDRRPAESRRRIGRRISQVVPRSSHHRAGGKLHLARLAHRDRRCARRAAGARDRVHRDGYGEHEPRPHHARRPHHRAWASGRRCHYLGRDDAVEDGAGRESARRCSLRLDLDRISDADRHARHSGGLPAVGFAKSSAGEYAGGIFWVVGLSLVVSWFVAVIFTPYLGVKLMPNFSHASRQGREQHGSGAYRLLRAAVSWSIQHRKLVLVVTIAAFVLASVGFTFVQKQFFPTSSRPELFIEIRMPEGSAIRVTEAAARQAEQLLAGDGDVKTFTTYVGAGSPRFFLALNPVLANESFALVVIMTTGPEGRERLKGKLERAVSDGAVPGARVRVDRLNFGPPVGFPVQFRVMGPDPQKLREIAGAVREIMRQNLNARDVQFDWNEQAKSIRLEVDQERARALGLTPQEVSFTLQALLSGLKIAEYREGINLIDIVARAIPSERLNLDGITDLTIPARGGVRVPLSQIARIHYDFEDPILWRRNRDYVLTVRADVTEGTQPPTVSSEITAKLQGVTGGLPTGYRIELGGSIEESNKANAALFGIFPVMFLAMLTLLMIQLQSFSKLFLVFSTAPLGVIGASGFLLAFDAPFGFTALLGLIALGGMIMRNTVILVEQIDEDKRGGLSPWDAIVESTIRRSRPVVLTALAAILAMIPLSQSVFWAPMAVTLMGGLLVATILTLLFLPALYAFWFRVRRPEAVAAPPPDRVEPAGVAVKGRRPEELLAPGE